ncbi:hypothetical protein ALC53_12669 [Atta colombica]|uniref:Uncharacterized protein n=1 Tax=Atta colombica TaxID=520822 RepID=A0A151HYW6_9HYME|nr:hypothetical protein ALC53_12669 [Atta colombica]
MGKSVEESIKRKREIMRGIERQKEEIFKRSNKLVRLPVKKGMREEMRELVGELGEKLMAEVREEMRVISEEIRKAAGDQKKMLKKEEERLKEE